MAGGRMRDWSRASTIRGARTRALNLPVVDLAPPPDPENIRRRPVQLPPMRPIKEA